MDSPLEVSMQNATSFLFWHLGLPSFLHLGVGGCQGFDDSHDFQLHLPGDAQSRPWCLTWSLSSVDATRAGVLYVLDVLMNKNHVNTTSDFPPNKDGTYENISKRTDQNHDFSSSVFFLCVWFLAEGGGDTKTASSMSPQKKINQQDGILPSSHLQGAYWTLDTGKCAWHGWWLKRCNIPSWSMHEKIPI